MWITDWEFFCDVHFLVTTRKPFSSSFLHWFNSFRVNFGIAIVITYFYYLSLRWKFPIFFLYYNDIVLIHLIPSYKIFTKSIYPLELMSLDLPFRYKRRHIYTPASGSISRKMSSTLIEPAFYLSKLLSKMPMRNMKSWHGRFRSHHRYFNEFSGYKYRCTSMYS